jgi:hypothetical protein
MHDKHVRRCRREKVTRNTYIKTQQRNKQIDHIVNRIHEKTVVHWQAPVRVATSAVVNYSGRTKSQQYSCMFMTHTARQSELGIISNQSTQRESGRGRSTLDESK